MQKNTALSDFTDWARLTLESQASPCKVTIHSCGIFDSTSCMPERESEYVCVPSSDLSGGNNNPFDINVPRSELEYTLLQGLLQQLPSSKRWTREKRDRWMQAFTASIDLLIDIEPEG